MGEKSRSPHSVVRFACFELDQEAGELRKEGGKCVRLQEQPLQILRILLERPGEIITRDELRRKIWPADTFVDFEVAIPAATNRIQSLAVLPLENLSRDPDQEFFADGMTEALITNLAKISALHVVSRTSAMYYKGVHRPLREIARELQVDGIVEGTVMRSGQRVRISAQLIDARTDAHLWAEIYDRDLRDVLELQSEVARTIASEVQVKVSPLEQTQLARTRSVDPEAYEAYLKGRYYWNKRTGESMKQGLECFQKAIEIDPTYAAAHAGVADSAAVLGWWNFATAEQSFVRAKEAAKKALSMDATLAEAHASLGFSLTHHDFDFSGAERSLKKALEINPRYATAAQWYGILLCSTGRYEEGMTELRRALRLDPLSLIFGWTYAHFLFFAGRFDEAIEEGQKVLALHPNSGFGRQVLGISWAAKGVHDRAIAELIEARRFGRIPNFLGSLGFGYGAAGKSEEAMAVAKELQEFSHEPYRIAYWMAMIYANLDSNEAFCWLEKAYSERGPQMAYLNVDRRFDKLRPDPRFQDLLRRMNFNAFDAT
jgi:TolB-like protein/Flp pilus assembly protein TadD